MGFGTSFSQYFVYVKQYFRSLKKGAPGIKGYLNVLVLCFAFPVVADLINVLIANEKTFVSFSTSTIVYIIVCEAIWCGLFQSILVIVKERANIKRDLVAGVCLRSYVWSRVSVDFVVGLIQSVILTLSFWLVKGKSNIPEENSFPTVWSKAVEVELSQGVSQKVTLEQSVYPEGGIVFGSEMTSLILFLELYLSIFLIILAADTLGICISCIAKDQIAAMKVAPYVIILELVLGGVLFVIPDGIEFLSKCMISRWGMESLGSILDLKHYADFADRPFTCELTCTVEHIRNCWIVLGGISLVQVIIGNILLHGVKKDRI